MRQPHEPMGDRTQTDLRPGVVAQISSHPHLLGTIRAVHPDRMIRAAQQRPSQLQIDELAAQRQPLDLDAVLDDGLGPGEAHDPGRERPRIPHREVPAVDREESLVAVAEVRRRRRQADIRSEQLRVLVAQTVRHPVEILPVRNRDRLAESEEVLLRGADLPERPVLDLRKVHTGREGPAVPGGNNDVDPLGSPVQVLVHLDRLHARVAQEPQAAQVALGLVDQLAVERVAGLEEQLAADDVLAGGDVQAVGDSMGCEQASPALVEDFPAGDLDDADRRRRRLQRQRLPRHRSCRQHGAGGQQQRRPRRTQGHGRTLRK